MTAEGAEKSQKYHKNLLQYSTFASNTSGSNMGTPNLLLAPGTI